MKLLTVQTGTPAADISITGSPASALDTVHHHGIQMLVSLLTLQQPVSQHDSTQTSEAKVHKDRRSECHDQQLLANDHHKK